MSFDIRILSRSASYLYKNGAESEVSAQETVEIAGLNVGHKLSMFFAAGKF